ncbi:hypothetical protein B0H19DRAFT_956295, partial [Mycena capillaripes]
QYVGDPTRGGSSADTENFTLLVSEMRAQIILESAASGKPQLLITVAAPADPDKFALIQGKAVSDSIDWFNLMTYALLPYDFYGNWAPQIEVQDPIADTLQSGRFILGHFLCISAEISFEDGHLPLPSICTYPPVFPE